MVKLSDVGKIIDIQPDGIRNQAKIRVVVAMVIKGPRGTCAIYDRVEEPMNSHLAGKGEAIKAFMEFNMGDCYHCENQGHCANTEGCMDKEPYGW